MQDSPRMQQRSTGDQQDSAVSEHTRNLAIILGSVLGGCAALLIVGIVLFILRRRRTQGSSIISRAVTPLDDAEFESWRRPSKQLQWREKYNVLPEPPAPALTRMPTSSRRNRHSRQLSRLSQLTEKELEDDTPMYSYRPSRTPEPGMKAPEHVRNKSSLSLQDRPPTPYSPTSSKESPKFPTQPTHTRPKSVSQRTNHVHYPSMSEASDFDFGFQQNNINQYVDKI
ncbi:hypothetical protein BFW01_g11976 [Lasiodiplodia theobromae]|uniref:Uncharacterized protein n=1 Tax=Lasiodiplodia theobromae TaxID=45133 RepID=A0A5N5D3R5_9PEZI|nr:C2h2 transcription factor [Lasiodiplodia theobromae]KAB2571964.1 hypothetical protein DBV05_g9389 [Lasiodiplodia theobromae]KAF4534265.1 C2h2 transcription factor [Lasiodiplodia theobromae]KAF9640170.1 hypothetical protein BFW01_g11976 [Lasiodiplodia theobromae]